MKRRAIGKRRYEVHSTVGSFVTSSLAQARDFGKGIASKRGGYAEILEVGRTSKVIIETWVNKADAPSNWRRKR